MIKYILPAQKPELEFVGIPSRRGLLVLNENKSIARFAADTYKNNDWYHQAIVDCNGEAKNPTPGFLLSYNGHMELFHNTFLDYVAASTMMLDPMMLDRAVLDPEDPRTYIDAPSSISKT